MEFDGGHLKLPTRNTDQHVYPECLGAPILGESEGSGSEGYPGTAGTGTPFRAVPVGRSVGRFGDARPAGYYSAGTGVLHRARTLDAEHGEPGCHPTIHPATTLGRSESALTRGSVSSE